MKPGAMLVNVGRAPLVQEQPLFDALREQRIGRAVLDVWYQYPAAGQAELAPASLPFHTLPNAMGRVARRYCTTFCRGSPLRRRWMLRAMKA